MSRKPKASKQIAHLLGEENLVSNQSVKGSWGIVLKNPPAKAGDVGSVPGVGRSPGERKWQPTPVFLPGEIPWTEKPGGLQSRGLLKIQT